MIVPRDAEFHPVASSDSAWAEVFSVGFSVPKEGINARIYLLFRPQFGVVQTAILITSKDALTPWRAEYADFRPHVPAPESLMNFTLENGLCLETIEPNQRWRLRFDDGEGVHFDVVFDALARPFSPFEAAQNPLAVKPQPGIGHFEQSGRITGELTLRGRTFAVNNPNLMNHGWGPRLDRFTYGPTGQNGGTWLHSHFDDGGAIYGNWSVGLTTPGQLSLKYGYVLVDGELRGLVSGKGLVVHDSENYPVAVEIEVTDLHGTTWRMASRALHRALWYCWPNMATFSVLAEWTTGDGRVGYGDILQFIDIASLIAVT